MLQITFTDRFQKHYRSLAETEKSSLKTNSQFLPRTPFILLFERSAFREQTTCLSSA